MTKMFCTMAALLFPLCGLAIAQPLADRIPADALVYVGWTGSDNLGPAYQSSHLKGVVDATDFPKLFNDFLPRIAQKLGQTDAQGSQKITFITSVGRRLWKYPSAFYFGGMDFTNPREPQPRIAILCDAGNEAEALRNEVQGMVDHADKKAAIKVINDGTLVVLTIGSGVTIASKGQANLTADAGFKGVMSQLHEKSVAAAYVNAAGIVKLIDSAPRRGRRAQQELEQWTKARDALGLNSVKGIGWTGAFDQKDWSTRLFVAAPAPRAGIFTLFDAKPVSDDALKLIPANATMAGACTADLAKLLTDIRSGAAKVDPGATAKIDQALDRFRTMTGLDLQKDVLDPLGDQWAYYSGPGVAGAVSFSTVVVNKLDDPAKAENALAQLSRSATNMASGMMARKGPGSPSVSVGETTSNGMKIQYVALPVIKPSWAIKNGVLYVGLWPQVVAAAATYNPASDKSILDNPDFAAIRQRLGTQKATSVRFADLAKTAPTVYPAWMFIFGYTGLVDMFYAPTPGMLLPPLTDLLKNLGPAGQTAWVDDAGWHMSGVDPFPGSTVIASDPLLSATGPLAVSILLPSLNRARETANRVKCASNERQIGQAILLYANENKGKYPPDLGTLIKTQDITIDCFVCPSSDNTIPPDIQAGAKDQQAAWVNNNSSYVYVGQGMNFNAPADAVVLYENHDNHDEDGMNFLYGDGHVEWQQMATAEQLLKTLQKPGAPAPK